MRKGLRKEDRREGGMERREERRERKGERCVCQEERGITLSWRQAFRLACGVSCVGQGGRSERSFGHSLDTGKV